MEPLRAFRQLLHKHPEVSGSEKYTSQKILKVVEMFHPDQIHTGIGGYSLAIEYSAPDPVKTLVFRADMDAVTVKDEINTTYQSVNPEAGHKCGHDGHMAILTGLAQILSISRPERTRVILLFQAEEETGTGAEIIVRSPWYQKLNPDWVFGLHNLPGYKKKHILYKEGTFAFASAGMKIHLRGKDSHAACPEKGISPAKAIAGLINQTAHINSSCKNQENRQVTLIHISMGEPSFGISPGNASVYFTLRAESELKLNQLIKKMQDLSNSLCSSESLTCKIEYVDTFPSTHNTTKGILYLKKAAKQSNLTTEMLNEPLRWSEDFGHYLKKSEGALFGLGAGENTPELHTPHYDFPDDIIETGIEIFYNLYLQIDKKENS